MIGREEWVKVGQVAALHVYPVKVIRTDSPTPFRRLIFPAPTESGKEAPSRR